MYKKIFILIILILFIGCGGGSSSSDTTDTNTTDTNTTDINDTTNTITSYSVSINVHFIDNNAIEIYWMADNNVKSYTLQYGTEEDGLSNNINLDENTSRYSFDDLEPDTVYMFRLLIVYTNGKKTYSNVLEVKTASDNMLVKSDIGP